MIALLGFAGLLASTWKQLVQSLCIGLTGREWVVKTSVLLRLSFLVVVGPIADWVVEHRTCVAALWDALPWILAVLVCFKMSAAAWIATRLHRSRLLSDRALVAGAASWLAVVLALYGRARVARLDAAHPALPSWRSSRSWPFPWCDSPPRRWPSRGTGIEARRDARPGVEDDLKDRPMVLRAVPCSSACRWCWSWSRPCPTRSGTGQRHPRLLGPGARVPAATSRRATTARSRRRSSSACTAGRAGRPCRGRRAGGTRLADEPGVHRRLPVGGRAAEGPGPGT